MEKDIIKQHCQKLINNEDVYGSDVDNVLKDENNSKSIKNSYEFEYIKNYTSLLIEKLKTFKNKKKQLDFFEQMTGKFSNVLDLMPDNYLYSFIIFYMEELYKNNDILFFDIKKENSGVWSDDLSDINIMNLLTSSYSSDRINLKMSAFKDFFLIENKDENLSLLTNRFILDVNNKNLISNIQKSGILERFEIKDKKSQNVFLINLNKECVFTLISKINNLSTNEVQGFDEKLTNALLLMACFTKNNNNQIQTKDLKDFITKTNIRLKENFFDEDLSTTQEANYNKTKEFLKDFSVNLDTIIIKEFQKQGFSHMVSELQSNILFNNTASKNKVRRKTL